MLPDFAEAKVRAGRDLLRAVEQEVPNIAPLLKGIAKFRQHEGRGSHLTRADNSKSAINYQRFEFSFTLSHEELKRFDLSVVRQKLVDLARQMAEEQTKRMLEVVIETAYEVGNVVHAGGELTQDKLIDIFCRVEMDFDTKTLKLLPGFSFVMHPEVAAKVVPKKRTFKVSNDPHFAEKLEVPLTNVCKESKSSQRLNCVESATCESQQ